MNVFVLTFYAIGLSALISFMLIPLASKFQLLDMPSDRKQHTGSIPLVGGISVFLTSMILVVVGYEITSDLSVFIISSSLLVIVGCIDDRFDLSVRVRIFVQVLSAGFVVLYSNFSIAEIGDIIGFGNIQLGFLAFPLTVLMIMAVMNAYNMVDGIDGLLGSLSVLTFLGIGYLAATLDEMFILSVCICMIGALIPFLVRNIGVRFVRLQKIFMGDAGSIYIGFIISWLILQLIGSDKTGSSNQIRPVIALWLVAVPLMDMLAIMIRRLMKGRSPFMPDRDHLHHIFMRAGFSPLASLGYIVFFAATLMVLGLIIEHFQWPEYISFGMFLAVFLLYTVALTYAWKIVSWIRRLRGVES